MPSHFDYVTVRYNYEHECDSGISLGTNVNSICVRVLKLFRNLFCHHPKDLHASNGFSLFFFLVFIN